ncbi:HrcA family transcriptional regulator, partial [Enterobacter mori]
LGIRYYVNQLLQQTSHQQQTKIQRLRDLLVENHYDISTTLSAFANELSIASQYTTLVMRQNHKKDIINNIHLIRANDHLVIMVVVLTS